MTLRPVGGVPVARIFGLEIRIHLVWVLILAVIAVVASTEAHEMVAGYVKELNERLNRWETIKKFVVLPRDLSVEDGELTPSMKVKRKAVEQAFAEDIEKMYAGSVAEL